MKLGYDIFRHLEDGSPIWVAQVNSIGEAKVKLESLQGSSPGQYFVRDAESGKVVEGLGPLGTSWVRNQPSRS
jgi:hypothetical protein